MPQRFTLANFKMNGSLSQMAAYAQALVQHYDGEVHGAVAVAPPFPYLERMAGLLSESEMICAAQNASEYPQGPYTGEVSMAMLADLGCNMVILGHSERRSLMHETSEAIAEKMCRAHEWGLAPVVCIGEHALDRDQNRTQEVLRSQLEALCKEALGREAMASAMLAYEPVWAIGTGVTATPELIEQTHAEIRRTLESLVGLAFAENMTILYGGSVTPQNASLLAAVEGLDGFLVGGASLDPQSFLDIARCCTQFC